MKVIPIIVALALTVTAGGLAQEQEAEAKSTSGGRVRYALILPQEKTPEVVKDTEHSPFESGVNPEQEVGTTEENLVRDILLRMPAVGGASGSQGMRVLLGGMRLVEGGEVPPVIPDQQVALKVKSISSSTIELMWVDKKPTNSPPKILVIPLDVAPKVRHRLPTGGAGGTTAGVGIIRRNGVPVLVAPTEEGFVPPASNPVIVQKTPPVAADGTAPSAGESKLLERTVQDPAVAEVSSPTPSVASPEKGLEVQAMDPPPSTGVPQASVLRMLFGNRPPPMK